MGMHSLTNVPAKADDKKLDIISIVEGENITIAVAEKSDPSRWAAMTRLYVGDHMLARPEDLRKMYASDIATAIRLARDAGYEQARYEIRQALGITR